MADKGDIMTLKLMLIYAKSQTSIAQRLLLHCAAARGDIEMRYLAVHHR